MQYAARNPRTFFSSSSLFTSFDLALFSKKPTFKEIGNQ